MLSYILRRLLLVIPTLLGITLVVFVTMAAAPGGISSQSLIDDFGLNPQEKKALQDYYNRRYGLDQPAPLQYLRWLNNVSPIGFKVKEDGSYGSFSLVKGSDLGESFRYGRKVAELLKERIPITLLLNVLTIPIIYAISILVGVRAAQDRGGRFDVTSSATMLALWSVPTMLTGVLLIGFFASDQYWHWFPTNGLSSREALDMPFLPHWGQTIDVLKLFLGMLGGLWFGHIVAKLPQKKLRMMLGGILGIGIGLGMGFALPFEPDLIVLVILSLSISIPLIALAGSDYHLLRAAGLITVGIIAGAAIASRFMSSEFVPGFLGDRLWHLVLPVLCLSYGGFAFLARLTRSAVLENLQSDYARTARAKGVSEQDVMWKHVFRNSLLPLITVSASLLPGLLGGSIIVESIFSIDGMGKLAVEAVQGRDRELVLSLTLISGLLTLVGYLLADLMYALVDPRVSYD
ncbi:MAG: ABC transporter permease [Thiotrichales bacterium]